MIATSYLYHIDLVQEQAAQKVKVGFSSKARERLHLSYNGHCLSFRVHYGESQRLFFFKTDFFQKTLFRNEYGVAMGRITPKQIHTGSVHFDKKQFRFLISGDDINLSVLDPETNNVLLKVELVDELLASNLDERNKQNLMNCVIFSLAWMLKLKGCEKNVVGRKLA